ncbi:hypothetical protein [Asanoa siamensis]|uniref:Uncharacterized protein n=1 Tax=Asanoa siamensis TaxID=926357 RepID=A0ABQ4D452_9ACTN|nr:hypothetical protein [Asanoa siamensis]GIF78038.1 hypothetical protein Asi02nite_75560 [Asanoa siamensis]
MTPVDRSGRVADRGFVAAVGWPRGTRLEVRERAELFTLHESGGFPFNVPVVVVPDQPGGSRHPRLVELTVVANRDGVALDLIEHVRGLLG